MEGSLWENLFPKEDKQDNIDQLVEQFTQLRDMVSGDDALSLGEAIDYMQESMGGLDDEVINFAQNNDIANTSTQQFTNSLEQQTASAKAGQIAMKGLAMAGNMLVGLAISAAISLVVKGLDELIHAEERAEEALKNAQQTAKSYADTIKTIRDETKSMTDTVDDIAESYAKLSQGVDSFSNKNISLSTEEYEEFLSLNNQLAELFPGLTKSYDENGNAILDLSGDVDTVAGSIARLVEQQKELAKAQLKDNLQIYVEGDEESGGQLDVIEGQKAEVEELTEALKEFEETKNKIINGSGSSVFNSLKDYNNFIDDIKNKLGEETAGALEEITKTSGSEKEGTKTWTIDFSGLELTDAQKNEILASYDTFYADMNSTVRTAQAELENGNKELSSQMMLWVEDLPTYEEGGEHFQQILSSMLQSIKWSDLGIEDFDGVKQYIQSNVLTPLQAVCDDPSKKAEVTNALSKLFAIDKSVLSIDEIESQVDTHISTIADILDKDATELKISLGFDDSETKPLINKVQGFLKDEFDSRVGELTLKELDIASKLNIPDTTLLSWDELVIKINEAKKASDLLSSIDDYKASISSLTTSYEALNTVLSEQNSNNYITAESYDALIKANSEFANALEYGAGYMRINSKKAIELAEIDAELALAELEVKEALEVQQYNKNAKEIDQLESSVDTLTETELAHLESLKTENSEIENNIRQYDLLESQIEQTLSGYNRFKQALATPNQDDAYLNIIEHLKTMKDLYDKNLIGYDEFQTGMSAYIGASATVDDFANSYQQLSQYFTEGQEGFDKFMNDLVKVGELQLDADGNIVGDLNWESAKESLAEYLGIVEITDEVFQSLIGRGEAYGAVISTTNGVDGIEDLTQAQNELNASIEEYKEIVNKKEKAGLDTSAEKAKIESLEAQLDSTTQKIEEFNQTEVEGEIEFNLDAELAKLDTSNLSEDAQKTLNQLNATNDKIKIMAQAGLDTTYLENEAKLQLGLLKEQMNVQVEVEASDVEKSLQNLGKQTLDTKGDFDALANRITTLPSINDLGLSTTRTKVQGLNNDFKDVKTSIDSLDGINATITVNTNGGKSGDDQLLGTTGGFAHVLGTAFANGNNIGAKQSSLALTGELGRELVVFISHLIQ